MFVGQCTILLCCTDVHWLNPFVNIKTGEANTGFTCTNQLNTKSTDTL